MEHCDVSDLELMVVVAQKYGSVELGWYMEALDKMQGLHFGRPFGILKSQC
jgi:hypothetical protein